MTLAIEQSAKREDEHGARWLCALWIDGDPQDLEEVEAVEYALHHTFRNPTRTVRSRRTKFRLNLSVWGEFMVRAQLAMKDGSQQGLEHWLRLEDALFASSRPVAVKRSVGSGGIRSVFLSFAASDSSLADVIGQALKEAGVEVMTANDAPMGGSLVEGIESQIEKSDQTLVLMSQDESPWLQKEIDIASAKSVPILPIVVSDRGGKSPVDGRLQQALTLKDSMFDMQAMAARIVTHVKERT